MSMLLIIYSLLTAFEGTKSLALVWDRLIVSLSVFLAGIIAGCAFVNRNQRTVFGIFAAEKRELTEKNNTQARLLSIIGHDLRGPMANVPVIIDMCLSNQCSTEERAYLLKTVRNNAVASLVTLDNLLKWGQRSGGTADKKRFNAYDTFLSDYQLAESFAAVKGIQVKNGVMPGLMVYADPNHFKFIMRNLLSNAIKFTKKGGQVEVGSDINFFCGSIVFFVKDNGIGMDAKTKSHLFGQEIITAHGTAGETGSGIGLLLCREFVNENNGAIWAESKQGEGSIFLFSLADGDNAAITKT